MSKVKAGLASLFFKLFGNAYSPINKYLSDIFNEWDPVKDVSNKTPEEIQQLVLENSQDSVKNGFNFNYIVPIVCVLALAVDSGLIYAREDFKYSTTRMPDLFIHQIYPREFWEMALMIIFFGLLMQLAIHWMLFVGHSLRGKCLMFLFRDAHTKKAIILKGGEMLSEMECSRILKVRRKTVMQIRLFYWSSTCQASSFFMTQLVLNWTWSVRKVVLFLFMPAFCIYILYAIIYAMLYFVLTVQYIRVKQQLELARIGALTKSLRQNLRSRRIANRPASLYFWLKYKVECKRILLLYNDISTYNTFWSVYLTVFFSGYILIIAFIAYGALFIPSSGIFVQIFFTSYAVEMTAFLLMLTFHCSKLIYCNLKNHKEHCRFLQMYEKTFKTIPLKNRIKIDFIKWDGKNVPRIGFTLLNNYKINSKMFELIVSYICLIIMHVFSEQLRQTTTN